MSSQTLSIVLTALLLPIFGSLWFGGMEWIERKVRAMKPGPLRRILLLGRRD